MRVNSSVRNLARARMIRSAKRSRGSRLYNTKALSSNSLNTTTNKRTTGTTTATKQIAMYERVEKSANALTKNVKDMMAVGEKTEVSEKDRASMISDIKSFVSNYNSAYSALGDLQGTANQLYMTMAGKVTESYTDALEKIGITMAKDGTLSIDKEVLEAADFEDIKSVLGSKDSYAAEISDRFGIIEQYASSSISSLDRLYGTSTYNRNGSYNAYGSDLSNYGFYNGKYYGGYSDWI